MVSLLYYIKINSIEDNEASTSTVKSLIRIELTAASGLLANALTFATAAASRMKVFPIFMMFCLCLKVVSRNRADR